MLLGSPEYDSQIEKIASLIIMDKTVLDEQDQKKLQKYYDYAMKNFGLKDEAAMQLVNEAFLYLKLKSAENMDPLQEADKFGAGFS
ncbi:MAG: hypothetical protein ACRD94_02940 [Nitrosopumilaceae archaeon]